MPGGKVERIWQSGEEELCQQHYPLGTGISLAEKFAHVWHWLWTSFMRAWALPWVLGAAKACMYAWWRPL